jgi:glycosyltransferase involved in cell wall biosynthesis
MNKLSVVIITFNEEEHLEKCLASVSDIADEILVVDSFSTDNTLSICEQFGVRVIEQSFLGYKEQKNFALNQAKYDHILSLDGDEALSDELKASILETKSNWEFDAYYFNRKNNYCGQWIHHSDWYPEKKIRLFKKGSGSWQGINPHDTYVLNNPKNLGFLKGDLLHWIYRSYSEHNQKIEKFSTIAAQEYYKLGKTASVWTILYRSFWAFFKAYVLRRGFLDGFNGFMICWQTGQVTFLKYAKLRELYKKDKKS